MNILYLTRSLNGLLMLVFPILIGIFLTRRFHLGWRIWWIGGATFVLSQVGHIPFNAWFFGLFNKGVLALPSPAWELPVFALLGGLSAGVFEECARYAAYRWWAKDARTWGKGLLMGAGHGGMEAILLGAIVLYTFFYMLAIRGTDLSTLVPAEQLTLAQQQVSAYWSAPWGLTLMGAVERAFTIPFHIACSVIVLQVIQRKQMRWLLLAIAYHTFLNASIAFLAWSLLQAYPWGSYAVESLLGLTVLLDLFIIFKLRTPEPEEAFETPSPLPDPVTALSLSEIPETPESLDNTRYNT